MSRGEALYTMGKILRRCHENGFNEDEFNRFKEISETMYGKKATKESFLHCSESLFGRM